MRQFQLRISGSDGEIDGVVHDVKLGRSGGQASARAGALLDSGVGGGLIPRECRVLANKIECNSCSHYLKKRI